MTLAMNDLKNDQQQRLSWRLLLAIGIICFISFSAVLVIYEFYKKNEHQAAILAIAQEQIDKKAALIQEGVALERLRNLVQSQSYLKMAVAEYYAVNGAFPISINQLGLTDYVHPSPTEQVDLGAEGAIVITINSHVSLHEGQIVLAPILKNHSFTWQCTTSDYAQLPEAVPGCMYSALSKEMIRRQDNEGLSDFAAEQLRQVWAHAGTLKMHVVEYFVEHEQMPREISALDIRPTKDLVVDQAGNRIIIDDKAYIVLEEDGILIITLLPQADLNGGRISVTPEVSKKMTLTAITWLCTTSDYEGLPDIISGCIYHPAEVTYRPKRIATGLSLKAQKTTQNQEFIMHDDANKIIRFEPRESPANWEQRLPPSPQRKYRYRLQPQAESETLSE